MDFTTTSDMGGDKFVPSDNEGLLVLTIGATEDTFDGQWGEVEISVVDLLVVLDHPDGPQVYTNAWVFGAALAPTLNRTNGNPFLGRLEKQKSKNGRDVWTFADPPTTWTRRQPTSGLGSSSKRRETAGCTLATTKIPMKHLSEQELECDGCGNRIWVHEVTPLSVKCGGGGLSPNLDTARHIAFVYNALGKRMPQGLKDRINREALHGERQRREGEGLEG